MSNSFDCIAVSSGVLSVLDFICCMNCCMRDIDHADIHANLRSNNALANVSLPYFPDVIHTKTTVIESDKQGNSGMLRTTCGFRFSASVVSA